MSFSYNQVTELNGQSKLSLFQNKLNQIKQDEEIKFQTKKKQSEQLFDQQSQQIKKLKEMDIKQMVLEQLKKSQQNGLNYQNLSQVVFQQIQAQTEENLQKIIENKSKFDLRIKQEEYQKQQELSQQYKGTISYKPLKQDFYVGQIAEILLEVQNLGTQDWIPSRVAICQKENQKSYQLSKVKRQNEIEILRISMDLKDQDTQSCLQTFQLVLDQKIMISEECSVQLEVLPIPKVAIKQIQDIQDHFAYEIIQIKWEIKNTGKRQWPENVTLIRLDQQNMQNVKSLKPGEIYQLDTNLEVENEIGLYKHQWKLQFGQTQFGDIIQYSYNVINPFKEKNDPIRIEWLNFMKDLNQEQQEIFQKLKKRRDIEWFLKYARKGWAVHIGFDELVYVILLQSASTNKKQFKQELKKTAINQGKKEAPDKGCYIF